MPQNESRSGDAGRGDSHEHKGVEVLDGVQRGLCDVGLAADVGLVPPWGEEGGRLVNLLLSAFEGGSGGV